MDQPYSFWADLLNKFHTSSEGIQALWLIMPAVTILGLACLAAQVLHAVLRSPPGEGPPPANSPPAWPDGYLLYGLYRNAEGHLMLYRHGMSRRVDPEELPSRLEHRTEKWIRFSLTPPFGSALTDALVQEGSIGFLPKVQAHFWVRCFRADRAVIGLVSRSAQPPRPANAAAGSGARPGGRTAVRNGASPR